MSEIVIIGPDGNRFVFPAGTDRETMRAAMRRRYTGANARTREMIMTSQLPDPELQGVRDYLGREQLIEDVRAGRKVAELEAATGPENIAKERFYTAAQGQTLGAAPLLQGAVNVPIAAVMYPFLTEEEKAGRDFGQFVSEMSSLGYDQARGSISRAREKRPLESAGIELGAGFLTGKTVYDELGKRFLASRTGARGAAVGAGAGGQYGFLEGEGDVGQGLEGALMGAPLGAGLAKTFEAAAEPIGRMFAKGPLPEQTFPPYEEMIAAQAEKTAYQRTPEFQRIEGEINTAYDDIANTERTIATELRNMGYTWDGEEGDFMNVIDSLRREGRLGNYLASQVEDLRNASGRLFDAEDQMKAHLQEVASAPATAPQAEQMFANRNVTLSGASTALPQAIVGGAGGSVLGSRTDLNGDGVIDEQDVFLGSAMGTVGVPAAMRAGRTVGRPIEAEARAMGAGGPATTAFDAHVKADELAQSLRNGGFEILSVRHSVNRNGEKSAYIKVAGVADELRVSDHSANMDYRPGQMDWTGPTDASAADTLKASLARSAERQATKTDPAAMLEAYEAPFKERYISATSDRERRQILREMYPQSKPNSRQRQEQALARWTGSTQTMGLGGGGRKLPPDSPEAASQQAARFETPGSPEYEAAVAKGLDMSTPARMARAKEMGFDTDTVLYHGTGSDVRAFTESASGIAGPGVYLARAAGEAGSWAGSRATRDGGAANVMPLYVRGKIANAAEFRAATQEAEAAGNASIFKVQERLQEKGFSGVEFEDGNINIFDPSNIRSVNAAFDPDKAKSSTLLAAAPFAVGGAGLGVAADKEDR